MQKFFNYLVFGASGFIGSEFVQHILNKPDTSKVMMVLRSKFGHSMKERLDIMKAQWQCLSHEPLYFDKLIPLDFETFFEQDEAREFILQNHVVVLNSLAETNMSFSLSELRVSNLFFVQKLCLWLRQNCFKGRLLHLSTAFVSGRTKGFIPEGFLGSSYFNFYEQSKAEAEIYLSTQSDLDVCVLRPSIVLGRSTNGFYRGTKVIYSLLRLYIMDTLKFIPIGGNAGVDCIPVDYLSEVLYRVARSERSCHGACFHVVAGKNNLLSTKFIFRRAKEVFEKHRGIIVPIFWARFFSLGILKYIIPHRLKEILDLFSQHLPYLGAQRRFFDKTELLNFLKDQYIEAPPSHSLVEVYLMFCKKTKWGKDLEALRD